MNREYWNQELETKPWPEVEAWQAGRIAAFVETLASRSDFYAGKLRTHSSSAGKGSHSSHLLREFPFTSKEEIRKSQQGQAIPGAPFGAHQAAPLSEIVQAISSSGTTGHPLYYALTRRDMDNWADGIANVFFTAGIRREDVVALLVGLPIVAGGLPYADGLRRIGATLAWLGGLPTERIFSSIPRLQVSAILATTSFGVYLTDHCRELAGCTPSELGVRKLLGGGEPGLGQPEIRQKIHDGWGISHVREVMGIGDVMSGLWGECEEGGGMHFNAQRYVAVELIDPQSGERIEWKEGNSGEAVYTTFDRDATPLLRYRSADHLVVTGTDCACGRTSPKISCIGRTDDMLIYKAMNIFPTAIRDVILRRFGDLLEPYMRIWKEHANQVRFDAPIPLEIEARQGVDPARYALIGREIVEEVRQHLQARVEVTVVAPGTLPRTVYKTPLTQVRPAAKGEEK